MRQKAKPLVTMAVKDREKVWDELYAKEEGIVVELPSASKSGKIRSSEHGDEYFIIDSNVIVSDQKLHLGEKVLFAPFQDSGSKDYAKIIKVITET